MSSVEIWGPAGFNSGPPVVPFLYINDMPLHLDHCLSQMYATLYQFSNSLTHLEYAFNRDLLNLSSWCNTNKLVKNAKKTHSLVICNHQKRRFLPMQSFQLNIDGIEIDCVDSVKMLGVIIDNNLTMASHIDTICTKISKLSGLLWHIRKSLTFTTKLLFYNSYIQPCFDYCSTAWGYCSNTHIHKLFRCERIILNNYDCSTSELLDSLNWLSVRDRISFTTGVLVYKSLNGLAPERLKNLFQLCGGTHGYPLRNAGTDLIVPRPKSETLRKSFSYQGSVLWNTLQLYIREAENITSFKFLLKRHLLSYRSLCS